VYYAKYLLDLDIYEPEAFEYVTYHTSQGFVPDGDYYRWTYQHTSTAYVDVTFNGSYSDLDLYSTELMRFSIEHYPDGDTASTWTHVVTPMNISGPKLVCSNPVSFYLNEMPEFSSANWEIKQGTITKSSGS